MKYLFSVFMLLGCVLAAPLVVVLTAIFIYNVCLIAGFVPNVQLWTPFIKMCVSVSIVGAVIYWSLSWRG